MVIRLGRNATIKSIDILLSAGFIVKVVYLPDNLDPDEILDKRGIEELKTLNKKTIIFIRF